MYARYFASQERQPDDTPSETDGQQLQQCVRRLLNSEPTTSSTTTTSSSNSTSNSSSGDDDGGDTNTTSSSSVTPGGGHVGLSAARKRLFPSVSSKLSVFAYSSAKRRRSGGGPEKEAASVPAAAPASVSCVRRNPFAATTRRPDDSGKGESCASSKDSLLAPSASEESRLGRDALFGHSPVSEDLEADAERELLSRHSPILCEEEEQEVEEGERRGVVSGVPDRLPVAAGEREEEEEEVVMSRADEGAVSRLSPTSPEECANTSSSSSNLKTLSLSTSVSPVRSKSWGALQRRKSLPVRPYSKEHV